MAQNERFIAEILLNDSEVQNKIKNLEKDLDELRKKRQEAFEKGDTKLLNQYDKLIDSTNRKLTKQQQLAQGLNKTLGNMSTAKMKELEAVIKHINKQLDSSHIERNSKEWRVLTEKMREAKTELSKMKETLGEHKSMWSRFFKFLNDSWGGVLIIFQSLSQLRMSAVSSVNDFAGMEEEMADVRKYTGMTDDQVRILNEDLKEMDTRTAREQLNQLAGTAGRLGKQAKDDVLDFVDAGNMIKVALGDDLGDGAIDKVGKLAMAFGEDKEKGLRGAMLATGSAINELSQNSSAYAGYLIDYTARVAGFGKQLGLTQAQIMGYGAVMDENLLRDEMAATAFGNMLTKMQTDTAKFAKIAGMDVKKFTDLLNTDANAAILALADNLKKADPQNMMKMLDDMGLDGSRAVGVLSTLADKIDDVRARQELATKAYEKATSIEDEYRVKNETVQAQIDKAKKKFHEMSVELGEQLLPVVRYTISGGSALIQILSAIVSVLYNSKATIISAGTTIAILTACRKADVMWSKLQIFWNEKLLVALRNLKIALMQNPWTAVFVAIAAVVGIIIDLKRRSDEAAESQRKLAAAQREQKAMAESMKAVNDEANKATAEEITKFKLLRKTLEDNTKKYDERKKALDEIKKLVPSYHGTLTTENTLINSNATALDNYVNNLMNAARAQAAFNRMVKLQDNSMSHEETLKKRQGNMQWAKNKLEEMGVPDNAQFVSRGAKKYNMYDENGKFIRQVTFREREQIEHYKKLVQYNERRISEEQQILDINKKQSDEMQKIIDQGKAPEAKVVTPYVSDADRKKQEAEQKKREAEEEKAKREALQKLKDADREQKAITDERLADNMLQYRAGLQDYRQYVENQLLIQQEGLKARMAVWDKESNEYKRYQKQYQALLLNGDEETMRLRAEDFERAHILLMHQLEQDFHTEGSAIYQNEVAYNEARFQEEMAYLEDRKELTRAGSWERMQIEQEIEDKNRQHQLENQITFQEMLDNVKTSYLQQTDQKRMELELNNLEELNKRKLLSEEEYQRARMAIKAQYADGKTPGEQVQADGANALKVAESNAKKNASGTADIPIIGTVSLYASTMEQLEELYKKDEISHEAYLEAKRQATANFCQNLASQMSAAFNGVNQLMSAASSYYGAQSDLEVAMTKKKYEKEIAAAGNNQRKIKKLQEKQAKEEAAIKTKYNRKQVKIQIAQAIAQTAVNALNAYGSAAAIPVVGYILAPIAAAMAVAAGMMQVAAIKKQAEAQEAGYYEGGFTGGKRYRKEAGVVHEGEFVANHQAVSNPNVLPLLQFLDQAQRNNTVGSLTSEDISRQLSGGNGAVVAPVVNVNTDNEEMRESIDRMNDTIDDLNETIKDGINTKFDMDDFEKNWNHHNKTKNR